MIKNASQVALPVKGKKAEFSPLAVQEAASVPKFSKKNGIHPRPRRAEEEG